MTINANDAVNFIIKWLCVGLVLHFGLALGAWLDGFIPWPA